MLEQPLSLSDDPIKITDVRNIDVMYSFRDITMTIKYIKFKYFVVINYSDQNYCYYCYLGL